MCILLIDESGATALEYGLLAALITLAIIGSLIVLGGQVSATFSNIASVIEDAVN